MSCQSNCGCLIPIGTLNSVSINDLDPCWSAHILNNDTSGNITVPLSGWYQLYLSANGANINNSLELDFGTKFIIAKLDKTVSYQFSLGDTSTFVGGGYNLSVSSPTQRIDSKAGIQFQYIGLEDNFTPALNTPSNNARTCQGSDWQAQRYSDGTDPFTMIDRAIIPASNFCSQPAMQENWYIADITLPEDGDYTFYVYGDDVGQLILDGYPLIWGRADRPNSMNRTMSYLGRGNYNSIGGHAVKHMTKGIHQIIIWNKNTGGGPSLAFCSVKDNNKREFLDFSKIRVLNRRQGCNNTLIIPTLAQSNSQSFNVQRNGTEYYLKSQYRNA